ncbi:hypothetical protein CRYO30217_02296 [Parvicella tangerina]|uniref:DUF3644 domain-containing protein n=2 Tax=Parvicella tangerina TaxID=2829795 RepID=A0A916JNH5_9FLAO|nr:hypothetical protein CRYO30217_02296 [Parvicella tangerina]
MLSAIEIYNKPDFKYREETFSILAINAWELLFKARLLNKSGYNMKSIYQLEPKLKKDGTKSKLFTPKLNRSGNPMTIGLPESILRLRNKGDVINENLRYSIRALVELRDNAIHFHNGNEISKEIQELGFACIKNYMNLIKEWELRIDMSQYNFYLMPLAYVDSQVESEAILTDEVKNYLNFLKKKVSDADMADRNFDVAIGIDISFKKTATLAGIGMRYDEKGVLISLSEEDITKKFPLSYKDVTDMCRERYSDFKLNPNFHAVMRKVKANDKLCHNRKLDPKNPKSQVKQFYNTNIWKELDNQYKKK